jgi:HAD superfamily hydrolase (TIGR01509 family)
MISPNHHRQIDAVLFDLDDTLIDWSQPGISWEDHMRPRVDNIYNWLQAAGHSLPEREAFFQLFQKEIRQTWDAAKANAWALPTFDDVVGRCLSNCNLDPAAIDIHDLLRAFDWRPMPGVVPFEDTIQVLQELHRLHYRLGLITNSLFPMWMRDVELQAYNLREYFDVRIASGDVGYLKPHPAVYQHALNLLGTTPDRVVFVGDRPQNDIAGANEVGMVSVLITPSHLDRPLEGVQPHYTITNLTELLAVLEILEKAHEQTRPQ